MIAVATVVEVGPNEPAVLTAALGVLGAFALALIALFNTGAGVAASAAIVCVLHDINASRWAAVLGIALTAALTAFEEWSRSGFAECGSRRTIIHHTITILVDAIAALGSPGMEVRIAIVAVRAAADRRRVAILVLIEDIEQADGRCRVATDVGLAGIALERLLTVGDVGASWCRNASLVDRAVLPGRTGGRAGIRADGMAACSHRVAGVDGAVEAIATR